MVDAHIILPPSKTVTRTPKVCTTNTYKYSYCRTALKDKDYEQLQNPSRDYKLWYIHTVQCYTNNYNHSKTVQVFHLFICIYKSQNVMLGEKASCKKTPFHHFKNQYHVLFMFSPLPNCKLCKEMTHTNLNTVAISR